MAHQHGLGRDCLRMRLGSFFQPVNVIPFLLVNRRHFGQCHHGLQVILVLIQHALETLACILRLVVVHIKLCKAGHRSEKSGIQR